MEEANALVRGNSEAIVGNATNIELITERMILLDKRLSEYGSQLNVQGAEIIELKHTLEDLKRSLSYYSADKDSNDLLGVVVQSNVDSNKVQRELSSKLEDVKTLCNNGLNELSTRLASLETNASLSPGIRNVNVNSEIIANAATTREYQQAKALNVQDITNSVKADIMKTIAAQKANMDSKIEAMEILDTETHTMARGAVTQSREAHARVSVIEKSHVRVKQF